MSFPYAISQSGRYILSRNGHDLMTATEMECWSYIHRHHSFSVEWAIKYEGYNIRPEDT